MGETDKVARRILHTNDLHVASLGDLACQSLTSVIDVAIESEVDLVIIAGDLFDHNKVKDDVISFVVDELKRLPVTAIILPGNHDCLTKDSVYNKGDFWKNEPNIHIISGEQGEIVDFPELNISLWGRPIDSYEHDVRPMAEVPQPNQDGYWHIAVAHGYFVDEEEPLFLSYHITPKEVTNCGWDYIALGHYPVFRCVSEGMVTAYYSDSPSLFGTVNIVDFNEENGVTVNRYSL